jgi:hypothetical protein
MLSHQRITLEAKDARGIDHRVENHAAGELSRAGENSPATRPSVYSSDQTLAFSREGQPESVMCLLGSS